MPYLTSGCAYGYPRTVERRIARQRVNAPGIGDVVHAHAGLSLGDRHGGVGPVVAPALGHADHTLEHIVVDFHRQVYAPGSRRNRGQLSVFKPDFEGI